MRTKRDGKNRMMSRDTPRRRIKENKILKKNAASGIQS